MSNPLKGPVSGQTARELAQSAASCKAPPRPCLPAVEQLGDRIMMSADMMGAPAQPQAVVNPPPQVSQILIGMMKGDTDSFAQDLAALKLAAGVDSKLGHKLADVLKKVDLAVYKFGKDLIKGEAVAPDMIKAAIDRQFLKVDAILARHPLDAQLKIAPTIDALQLKAHELVAQLAAVGPSPELSKEDRQTLNKISLDWAQMSKGALKVQEQIAFNKEASREFLKIKFADLLVSSLKVEDPTLRTEINNAVGSAEQILIGLLVPASTGDVISG
jgi:hypothetical protein